MPSIFRHPIVTHGAAGIMVAAAIFISPWEGYFGKTYRDVVGVPTVCYGETAAVEVKEGETHTFTKQECQQMLAASLPEYDRGMMGCLSKPITDNMHVAFLSTTYNIGVHGFCRSGMAKLVNANDNKGACDALLAWNKAGGRVVKGLDNRRKAERALCLQGL